MAKKETAEEKLLKIIEATKKAKGGASSAPVAVAAARPSSLQLLLSPQHINMALIAAVLAGFLFLVYQIKSGVSLLNEDVMISTDASAPQANDAQSLPAIKDVVYYLDKISARNIFQPYEKKADEGVSTAGDTALKGRLAKYKLVGVAWLDVPESATVMIENTSTHETRFLREGDKIDDVTVKTIFTDRVVFSYANEEMTVKL
ncbi:MAG: hypothetical protein HQL17_01320 [Candidatus Omnitrophica bacterium]|nr:hypothetical protein [Candidatus Omnitrophota bacterium]